MPFVNIDLHRGKSTEYLEDVSHAVHDALVAELGMHPDDDFQVINQHEPGELVFHRDFRGGPRSDDWIVLTITEGVDRGQVAKRRFYRRLVELLAAGAGIGPEDVFVMFSVTPPINFSFAGGIAGTDVVALETFEAERTSGRSRTSYQPYEIAHALDALMRSRDLRFVLPMLRNDVLLKVPSTLSYGGEFTGPEAFEKFFSAGVPGGPDVWESFEISVEQVIEGDGHIAVQLANTAIPKSTGEAVLLRNLWLFTIAGGRISRAELYADTAAAASLSASA